MQFVTTLRAYYLIIFRTKSKDILSKESDVVAVPIDYYYHGGKSHPAYNLPPSVEDSSTDTSTDSEGEVIHNIRKPIQVPTQVALKPQQPPPPPPTNHIPQHHTV